MKTFTITTISTVEGVTNEIDRLKIEIENCQHSGPIIRWETKYNGGPIIANLCEKCGRTWWESKKQ